MKKGFTLVEVLAVLVVLAIFSVITFPIVSNVISNSRKNLGEEQKLAIENAARAWGLKNLSESNGKVIYNNSEIKFVSVTTLQSSGALDSKKLSGLNIGSSAGVCIKYASNQFTYKYASSSSAC